MIKKCIVMLCFFLPFITNAKQEEVLKHTDGFLQAYWLPAVNDDGTEGKPELMLRFLDTQDKNKKVISLFKVKSKDGNPNYSVFEDKKDIDLIKSNFNVIPDNFFKFKEGHIEQYGTLTSSQAYSNVECDTKYYYAKFHSFQAKNSKAVNEDEIAKLGGCDGYAYLQKFIKNSKAKEAWLSKEPDLSSDKIHIITADDTIVKIKTVNPQWIYAAVYDYSKPDLIGDIKGYIRKSDLDLLY